MVKRLIKAGVDINQSDGNKTPLIVACENNYWIVVEELNKAENDVIERKIMKTPRTVKVKWGINMWSII